MSWKQINTFFNPESIAVVGASNRETSVGCSVFKNIKDGGYRGKIFAVNNKTPEVQGTKTYASVLDIKENLDLVVIATPAPTVIPIVLECVKNKVGGVAILSSGFKEAGPEGRKRFDQLKEISEEKGIKILGPNCLGFINPRLALNASFAPKMPVAGSIAFISQSGALCDTFLDWAVYERIGFSYFVSVGSMADISFPEMIDYCARDPHVSSILIYMESLNDARKFMSSATAFSKHKPIIVLKGGVGTAGTKAVMSHTGTVAGSDYVFETAFRRAGVVRARTISELFNYTKTLAKQKIPEGNRLAIITNAGGPAVISTDFLTEHKGELANLSPTLIEDLNRSLPPAWSKSNPIDLLGDALPRHYKLAVEACLKEKDVDGILTIITPQAVTQTEEIAEQIVAIPGLEEKPVFASLLGEDEVRKGADVLRAAGIPAYRTPEKAINCFLGLWEHQENLKLIQKTPEAIPTAFSPNYEACKKLIRKALHEKKFALDGTESKQVLKYYDIPVNPSILAKNVSQAEKAAEKIGFPLALKIESPDIIHKTDCDGVVLDISSKKEAAEAFLRIVKSARKAHPDAAINGVSLEKMVQKKFELLIGSKKDQLFGPVIVFGLGGVAVEIFKDIAAELPPLNMALAKRMIEETKIYRLLKGFRGMAGVDIRAIQFLLYKFSYLVMDFPEIKEVDINPFAADENGGCVLDVKIILDQNATDAGAKPYSHLAIIPYIKDYEKTIKVRNRKIFLRPIMAEDEPRHKKFIDDLSESTKRYRFFKVIDKTRGDFVKRYTQIDYAREIGIIAEMEDEGVKKTIGVARLIGDPLDNTAEFAIVVSDCWQNKGLGSKLLEHMISIARKEKIKTIYLAFLADNVAIRSLIKKYGFDIEEREESCFAELNL
jgi:acetyltransferase